MKREKYVKINWKSIECDVKIKFIRAATSERSPWEFILWTYRNCLWPCCGALFLPKLPITLTTRQ